MDASIFSRPLWLRISVEVYIVCALHEHHAAHTVCKLQKKIKYTNLISVDIISVPLFFQRVKVPYRRD